MIVRRSRRERHIYELEVCLPFQATRIEARSAYRCIVECRKDVEGVVFKYDPDNDDKVAIKDVPDSDVLVRLGGSWKDKIVYTLGPKPVVSFFLTPSFSAWSGNSIHES